MEAYPLALVGCVGLLEALGVVSSFGDALAVVRELLGNLALLGVRLGVFLETLVRGVLLLGVFLEVLVVGVRFLVDLVLVLVGLVIGLIGAEDELVDEPGDALPAVPGRAGRRGTERRRDRQRQEKDGAHERKPVRA